jgi:hypothetical protein
LNRGSRENDLQQCATNASVRNLNPSDRLALYSGFHVATNSVQAERPGGARGNPRALLFCNRSNLARASPRVPGLHIDVLGFIETSRVRFDRVVEAVEAVRAAGAIVNADAVSHGATRIATRGWLRAGKEVSPLGAVCLELQPKAADVVLAVAEALVASPAFAAGLDDGSRARPDAEKVADPSYLRGLEFGYEVRFYLRRAPR